MLSTRNWLIAGGFAAIGFLGAVAGCGDDEPLASEPPPVELSPGVGPVVLDPEGGTHELVTGKLLVTVPPDTLTDRATIEANEVAAPAGMPAGLTSAGSGFEISVSDTDVLDGPLRFTVPYDPDAPGMVVVMHHTAAAGYRPATVLHRDAVGKRLQFETRSFSTFVLARQAAVPDSAIVTQAGQPFNPLRHGFSIPNVTYPALLSTCGSCLGMVTVARWHFLRSEPLYERFSPQVQSVLAMLAHAGASPPLWADADAGGVARDPAQVVKDIKALVAMDEPVALILRNIATGADHAVLVFGYDRARFLVYDPNSPGQTTFLPYGATGIQPFDGYTEFRSLVIETTLAPRFDIDQLIDQAVFGFEQSPHFAIDAPVEGEEMNVRRGRLTGTVANAGIERVNLITAAGLQVMDVGSGLIQADFPVFGGTNALILLGGPAGRSRLSYARIGGLVRTFTSPLPRAELFAMITWKQAVDVDLYVHGPSAPSDVAWYDGTPSASGLVLDIDSPRFGPELTTLSTRDPTHPGGRIDPGPYRVRAHYFKGSGAVSGEVLIAIHENQGPLGAACRIAFSIASADEANDHPDGTGPDWRDLAAVDVAAGTITPAAGLACKQGDSGVVPP